MPGHPLSTKLAIIKLFVVYAMHSSFAYRQFNSNFTCGNPSILPHELIHSRNRGTVGYNVFLPRAWQVFDVYAPRLITLTTRIWCTVRDTALRAILSSAVNL
ncbi:hypothetical protein AVEN_261473-1 [Araneus ventricosus]|uniref:Secreted protein n=1 Tax=Araneus ventricosus TaxID=182803 RepID=A0A4Y2QJ48_ARAVE|nr:hypothetical protein AVEN_35191-1 [Araneus ventricosus]GBN63350.1 hypothetical protein AVEN_261473-1 [Araneus ventricosus]